MTTRLARLAVLAPLTLLAACGGSDDPVPFTITSGTYAVSGATVGSATPGDQCLLIGTYQAAGKRIDIDVNAAGTVASFDLGQNNIAIEAPSATINGNSLEAPVQANYTVNLGNCLLRVRRSVVGDLTANDAAALQLSAQITIETNGTDCDGTPYVGVSGCRSDIHFLVTKVLP
jgi:hypothetical protein